VPDVGHVGFVADGTGQGGVHATSIGGQLTLKHLGAAVYIRVAIIILVGLTLSIVGACWLSLAPKHGQHLDEPTNFSVQQQVLTTQTYANDAVKSEISRWEGGALNVYELPHVCIYELFHNGLGISVSTIPKPEGGCR
jgi:hypothetical protein